MLLDGLTACLNRGGVAGLVSDYASPVVVMRLLMVWVVVLLVVRDGAWRSHEATIPAINGRMRTAGALANLMSSRHLGWAGEFILEYP